MTCNSKRTLVNMTFGILISIAYIIYAFSKNAPEAENLKSWATVMLVFIGIGIIALILIQIIFHILSAVGIAFREQDKSDKEVERIISSSIIEDERDKVIALKSNRIGYICSGLGFIIALAVLALGFSAVVALHVFFCASFAGSIAEGCMSIYYYERGVRNG